MVDADPLRVVFRANEVDFVMPAASLLAIRGVDEEVLAPPGQGSHPFQLSSLVYRNTEVKVYDLGKLFALSGACCLEEGQLLIFSGSDCPWAVKVDHVSGVIVKGRFELQTLPSYMFNKDLVPYHQIAMYDGQLLVSVDVDCLDQTWSRCG